ncbi:glycosyltransferase family 4 protein [Mucilaginibacter daejeonensis]|uniref:glycosyltransferase family 4 protein n=1 Tax=Mucilaginibacter daejeonensis TaxID=398049 RepID=UPI001D1738D6|nr:glycosyltransferase family 4 protein [Mucilaginibacter daejeonensis]UEG52656.1 glycosyltransferase family 4 protein [Mucilaginibacter daejeonensis]
MRILLITHKFYPHVGGTEANAEFLAQAFCDKGAEVHLITWTKEVGDKRFPYIVLREPSFCQLWKEHLWAEVVFENSPVLRLSWPVLFTRKPLAVSLNTWLTTEGKPPALQSKVKFKWLKQAKVVVAVSDAIRKDSWQDAVVIENAYNDKLFSKKLIDFERNGSFVFLGRLVSDKGVNLAILALASLVKKYALSKMDHSGLKLTVIGDGVDKQKLQDQAFELGISERVSFVGSLSGEPLVNILNEHKYMLIPSAWREPFGIVALEGLACGCIPIVADGGGLPDAVGAAGLVFKRGDVTDLADKMEMLLNNDGLKNKLKNASANQLSTHSPEVVSQRYFELLLSITDKRR